jgi:hypothetical protein
LEEPTVCILDMEVKMEARQQVSQKHL